MSGEPINFRTAKKRVKTARRDAEAAENRVKFGQTKAQKQLEKSKTEKSERHLDGHRLDGE